MASHRRAESISEPRSESYGKPSTTAEYERTEERVVWQADEHSEMRSKPSLNIVHPTEPPLPPLSVNGDEPSDAAIVWGELFATVAGSVRNG
jgi:hypothetical protein